MSYSQNGELELFLDNVFGNRKGFFLEIGAWDGFNLSQTAYLEKVKGWKGICVEPFPHNFEHRSCLLCNKAISADGKDRQFVWVTTDKRDSGDVSYLSGFRDTIKTHWDFIYKHCNYEEVAVETITIEKLYKRFHLPLYIDFLSVDTEGAEVEIFCNMNLDHYRFGVISFEHNLDINVQLTLGRLLEKHGYVFHSSMGIGGIEDVYVSRGLL